MASRYTKKFIEEVNQQVKDQIQRNPRARLIVNREAIQSLRGDVEFNGEGVKVYNITPPQPMVRLRDMVTGKVTEFEERRAAQYLDKVHPDGSQVFELV